MLYLLIILLIILFTYLYLSMPARRKLDLEYILAWDYAHRGFHDNNGPAPENSLLAIKKAVDKSYGIEFDIRLSKDGQIVIFHDSDLKRICGLEGKIRDLDYNQLKNLKLLDSQETIPLFNQALEIVAGKVPIIVELKCPHQDVHELASKTSDLLDAYDGVFMVESFNPYAIKWFKENRPQYIRGQLSSGNFPMLSFKESFLMKELLVNFLSRPDFIAYEHKYRNKLTLWIQKHIWKTLIICYTVKLKEDYSKNKEFFDLIIFESFTP